MYKPKTQKHTHDVSAHISKKLTVLTAASFIAFCLLAITVIVLSLVLITRNRQLVQLNESMNTLGLAFYKKSDELTLAQRELTAKNSLPSMSAFAQQCSAGSNTDQALLTPLNTTPIEGYNVFLIDCRSNIKAGRAEPRVAVFRANNDGTKEFTYAAAKTEPLCIPNKLPVAAKLAEKLEIPVCINS